MDFEVPLPGQCEEGTPSFVGGFEQVDGAIVVTGSEVLCPGETPGASLTLDPGEIGGEAIPIGTSCGRVYVHYREVVGACVAIGFSVYDNNGNSKNPTYAVGSGALAFQGQAEVNSDFSPTKSELDCTGDPQVCAVAEGTEIVHWEQFGVPVALGEGQDPVPCGPDDGFTCSVLRAHRHGDDDQSCDRHLDWVVRKIQ